MLEIVKYLSENFKQDYWILITFLLSLSSSFVIFPVIISLCYQKKLMVDANERSSHSRKTPTLGGVGIFIGVTLALSLYGSIYQNEIFPALIGSLIMLFFLGIKDDILVLSARTKFTGQLIASLFIIFVTELRIDSFHGMFTINSIGYLSSVLVTLFTFLVIINAYNLVDGIDGLAGVIAIIFSIVSGIIFYALGEIYLATVSFSLVAALLSFLYYNFSNKRKIFMGDTGSLIVGFLIAYLSISLLSFSNSPFFNGSVIISPIIIISLFFYPLVDTLRIFMIRVFVLKKSPFLADKNHIHHRFLSLGFNHWQISLYVGMATFLLVFVSFLITDLSVNVQLLIVVITGLFIFIIPHIISIKEMRIRLIKVFTFFILLYIGQSVFVSCTTKKDVLYFQSPDKIEFISHLPMDQKIETNDIISVRISSLDIESSRVYNADLLQSTTSTPTTSEGIKLKGFLVNNEGNITLPVLGVIAVTDKSTSDLESYLSTKLINEGHLKNPNVVVWNLNSKVTILGEVKVPGTYSFLERTLTLLPALGLAGDFTINGKRNDVLLIRQENGVKNIIHIDLTSTKWFDSEAYFIKQNDVIIVNPNYSKTKSGGIIGNTGTVVSLISLLLTTYLLLKK